MKIIVVYDLSSVLRFYNFNKNIKTAWCLNLKHIISKRRERERETLIEIVVTKKTKPVDCVSLNL
jgi:hypothetical protein